MRGSFRAYAIGTYYKVGSPLAGPNAGPMRGLCYLVKNNREQPSPNTLHHPRSPRGMATLLRTPAEACEYVAEILAAAYWDAMGAIGLVGLPLALVPVPPSNYVGGDPLRARWPARDLAAAMMRRGLGALRLCVVNKGASPPKHRGERVSADRLAAGMALIARPGSGEAIVYVDDVVTWGDHLSAVDAVMGAPAARGAVAVGIVEGSQTVDCYEPRSRSIAYDTNTKPWAVSIW